LNVLAIQYDIFWENPIKNKEYLDSCLINLNKPDLIIFPEMFNTGFSMNASKISEKHLGETCFWMQEKAKELETSFIGSIPVNENGKYYNRLYVVNKTNIEHYDKRHLFTMANEHNTYSSGCSDLIININGWKIKPLICYDLRFPVFSRNKVVNQAYDYDVLIYIANWPAARSNAWVNLLQSRAIENLSYSVGVNRIGTDFNGIVYNGSSRVFDFKGKRIDSFVDNEFSMQEIQLDKTKLDEFRLKFPTLNDADQFTLLD
jgi:predicted amidohydrolase